MKRTIAILLYALCIYLIFNFLHIGPAPAAAKTAEPQPSLPMAGYREIPLQEYIHLCESGWKAKEKTMINIPTYSQWGQPWSQKQMKPSQLTLASHGCFITSLTMAMHNYAITLDPGQVLDKLVATNGLALDGQLTYDGVMRAFPWVYFYDRIYTSNDPRNNGLEMQIDVAIKKIKRLLDCGQPVILSVDNIGNDGYPDHAVLAYDYTDTDFKIKDPDGGKDILFSAKYGDPKKKLYGYVALIGPPIGFPDQSQEQADGIALWKASQIRKGINVQTYTKELIDSLL